MKKKFKNFSQVFLITFLVLLAIIVGYSMIKKSEEIILSKAVGIAWVFSGAISLVCVMIALVLDAIASWKKDKVSYCLGLVTTTLAVWLVLVAVEYYINDNGWQLTGSFWKALVILCSIKAGNYIFEK